MDDNQQSKVTPRQMSLLMGLGAGAALASAMSPMHGDFDRMRDDFGRMRDDMRRMAIPEFGLGAWPELSPRERVYGSNRKAGPADPVKKSRRKNQKAARAITRRANKR